MKKIIGLLFSFLFAMSGHAMGQEAQRERDRFHCGKTFVTVKMTESFDDGKGTFRYTTVRKAHIQYTRFFPNGYPLVSIQAPGKVSQHVWLEGLVDWLRLVACLD